MERGASEIVLATRSARADGADVIQAGPPARGTRRRLVRALAGFGDTCALACVALLGCLALIALGTVASLLWMLLAGR